MRQILNVFKKEKIDFLRDRRAVLSSLAFALFGPLTLFVLLTFLAEKVTDKTPTQLAVVGAEHAPNMMNYLVGEGVEIVPTSGASREAQLGKADALLVIPEAFVQQYEASMPASIRLFIDRTNQTSSARAEEISMLIRRYSGRVSEMRLMANGVPSVLSTPIMLETANLAEVAGHEKQFASTLLYLFVFAPFIASLGAAIDMTAGERERKSLQPLLAQPISTRDLIIGKWMVAAGFGLLCTAIAVLSGVFAFISAPLDVLGIKLNLDIAVMLANLLPFAVLVAALQMLVALNAKSYKEANTHLQLLTIAPALVFVFLMFNDTSVGGFVGYLPVVGQMQAIQDAVIGGEGQPFATLINAVVSFALAGLCLQLASKKLGSEQILQTA